MKLVEALDMAGDEVVALVGRGGKTMSRLAREMVEKGGRAITTTTTCIFAAQIGLAPVRSLRAVTRRIWRSA